MTEFERQPIRPHPQNPRIFLFRGEPTVLITSAEHYGAVINGAIDYSSYLDELSRWGLNATRIYPGGLFEKEGDFLPGNTLGPRDEDLVLPWSKSEVEGKYDLGRWNEAFFTRLHAFVSEASRLGIVVEVCFFNAQYPENWPLHPLHPDRNIQGAGCRDHRDHQTLREPSLFPGQAAYVAKLVQELKGYDNVVFEICDEPGLFGTPAAEYHEWISRLIDVVRENDDGPHRHSVAQQVQGILGEHGDFSSDPRVDIIVGQYLWNDEFLQAGGLLLLEEAYHHRKPIELNETCYYPIWYVEDREAASRVEGWEFMIGGGASFNHLNGIFTPENPRGEDEANHRILRSYQALHRLLKQVDLVKMERKREAVGGHPEDVRVQCLADGESAFLIYFHDSLLEGGRFRTKADPRAASFTVALPEGKWEGRWINPEDGSSVGSFEAESKGGTLTLTTPVWQTDLCLSLAKKAL